MVGVDGRRPLRVEDHQVAGQAGRQVGPPLQDSGRPVGQAPQQVEQGHAAPVHQGQGQRQQALQPDDAGLGHVEGQALGVLVVRAVVAGDGVDGAVGHRGRQGLAVPLAAQGRGHLGEGAVVADRRLVQREVVRRRAGRDRQAARFGPADHLQRLGAGDVGHVVAPAGHLDQPQVALDHDDLVEQMVAGETETGRQFAGIHRAGGEARFLRVLQDDRVHRTGVAEGAAHHLGVGHGLKAVGEAQRAVLAQ